MTTATTPATGISTWTIDPAHTVVEFSVKHLMIATVKGSFGAPSGTVKVREDDLTTAEIDVTIDTTTIDTRQEQRDNHLRSADFFDVERFPSMHFKSTKVERRGDDYRITGNLTIRGVTKPIVLEAVDEGRARDPWGKDRAIFSATGKIRRSEYGLNWNQALEAGGVLVGDEIKLSIDAQLVRE
jgi:polyisoprenoid-binding protein YceI